MKKSITIVLYITLGVVLIALIRIYVVRNYVIPLYYIVNSQADVPETFLTNSQSPDGKYNLEAYRTNPGATVDFSIMVYIITDNRKELIYDAYHEYDVEIVWLDNSTVSINGKTLDMSRGEKYNWRTQLYS